MPTLRGGRSSQHPLPLPVKGTSTLIARLTHLLRITYLPDWLTFVLLQSLTYTIHNTTHPWSRQFTLSSPAISHPYTQHQRVSSLLLFILGGAVPLGSILVLCLSLRRGWHETHVSILGLLLSHGFTSFLTDVLKNAIGRPRPDLLDRCQAAPGTDGVGWVDINVCTQEDTGMLWDGFRSFPSGHSSFSFAGLAFLGFYLTGLTGVVAGSGRGVRAGGTGGGSRTNCLKITLVMAPFLAALLVALTRLVDYRHDVYDITAGSLLGLGSAWLVYRRFFNALSGMRCGRAYQPRGTEDARNGVRRKGDEENQFGVDGDGDDAEDFSLQDFLDDEDEDDRDESGEERRPLNNDDHLPSGAGTGIQKPDRDPG